MQWWLTLTSPSQGLGECCSLLHLQNLAREQENACPPQPGSGQALQPPEISCFSKAAWQCCDDLPLCQAHHSLGGVYQCLHLGGAFPPFLALPVDTSRFTNDSPSHIVFALFKLLLFHWVSGWVKLHMSHLRGESQFPIVLWDPWTSAQLVF